VTELQDYLEHKEFLELLGMQVCLVFQDLMDLMERLDSKESQEHLVCLEEIPEQQEQLVLPDFRAPLVRQVSKENLEHQESMVLMEKLDHQV